MDEEEQIIDQEELEKMLILQEKIKKSIADAMRDGKAKTDVVIGNKKFYIKNVKLLEPDKKGNVERYAESEDGLITVKEITDPKTGKKDYDIDFNVKKKELDQYLENKRTKEDIKRKS